MKKNILGGERDINNKYQCDHTRPGDKHEITIVCIGCLKAWIERHDALLKLVKQIKDYPDNWDEEAKQLLIEIGIPTGIRKP